jgi:hypothetical protein
LVWYGYNKQAKAKTTFADETTYNIIIIYEPTLPFFPSPAEMSITKLSLAGNYENFPG